MTDQENIDLLNNMLKASEELTNLYDWIANQRDELIKRGFSPTAAEQMAMTLWLSSFGGASK